VSDKHKTGLERESIGKWWAITSHHLQILPCHNDKVIRRTVLCSLSGGLNTVVVHGHEQWLQLSDHLPISYQLSVGWP